MRKCSIRSKILTKLFHTEKASKRYPEKQPLRKIATSLESIMPHYLALVTLQKIKMKRSLNVTFKNVNMDQEAPFKENSRELGLFSNGEGDRNGRVIIFPMGGFNTPYGLCIIYKIYVICIYIYMYIHI